MRSITVAGIRLVDGEREAGGQGGGKRLTEHDGDVDEEVNQVEEVKFAGPY